MNNIEKPFKVFKQLKIVLKVDFARDLRH